MAEKRLHNGQLKGVVQIQNQLGKSEKPGLQRSIFNTFSDAIAVLYADGAICKTVNEGFTLLTGWTNDDVIGKSIYSLNLWHRAGDCKQLFNRLSISGTIEDFQVDILSSKGRAITVMLSAFPIMIDGSEHILIHIRDTTPLAVTSETTWQQLAAAVKKSDEQTRRMQKRLDQFQSIEALGALAAGIAHDLNNILFPINGYAEMLINDLPEGSDLWENATGILESGLRARNLVKQILTITHGDDEDDTLKSIMPHLIVKETL